jgi:hypothetical protein
VLGIKLTQLNNLQPNLKELACRINNPLQYDFAPTLEKLEKK